MAVEDGGESGVVVGGGGGSSNLGLVVVDGRGSAPEEAEADVVLAEEVGEGVAEVGVAEGAGQQLVEDLRSRVVAG